MRRFFLRRLHATRRRSTFPKKTLKLVGPRQLGRPPACQGPVQLGVVTVDILGEMDGAILRHRHGRDESRNIGMLTATNRFSPRCGSHRSRSSANSICRTRQESGTRRATCVSLPSGPSAWRPCRIWKRFTASTSARRRPRIPRAQAPPQADLREPQANDAGRGVPRTARPGGLSRREAAATRAWGQRQGTGNEAACHAKDDRARRAVPPARRSFTVSQRCALGSRSRP